MVIRREYTDLGISLSEHGPSGIVSGEGNEGEENTVTIAEVELSHERRSGSIEFEKKTEKNLFGTMGIDEEKLKTCAAH